MKKLSFILAISFILSLLMTISVFAHAGRTDSNDGHKDNKNKSGLGGYHYHCGGNPAHLHTNGACPYDMSVSTPQPAAPKTTTTTQVPKENPKNTTPSVGDPIGDVLYSDITAYINGNAIPTSVINGKTLVVVEDLAKYGFDVKWDDKARTLKVELNKTKKITPLTVEKNTKPVGTFKMKYLYTDIKTYLSDKVADSYAIDGLTLIDFELLEKYGKITWNENKRELRLTIG